MPAEEIKAIYDALKSDGELGNMFPGMTGDWRKDERFFTRRYIANEDALEAMIDEELIDEEYLFY